MSTPFAHKRQSAVFFAGALSLLTLAACAPKADQAADTAAVDTAAAAAPAPAGPSDPQIAHIAVTANSIDSTAGAVAVTKAQNKDVKAFAQMMVTDHGGVNQQAVALATKLGVTPEDNDVSRQLLAGADQSATELQAKTGADFDKAYMDREVAFHQAVLDAVDQTLIPSAQNAELKDLLVKVRPAFVAHLERAKSIRSSLGA